MVKFYNTRAYTSLKALSEDISKLLTKLLDNDCSIITVTTNTNGNQWIGTIFYKSHKTSNFTLR